MPRGGGCRLTSPVVLSATAASPLSQAARCPPTPLPLHPTPERLAGWEPNGPRENNDKSTDWGRVTPRPFRTEEEKVEQQAIITVEQEKLAVGVPSLPPGCCASSDLSACVEKAQGHYTPKWAARDYMDIAGKGSHPNDKNGKSRSVFLGRDGAGEERPKASERAAAKL